MNNLTNNNKLIPQKFVWDNIHYTDNLIYKEIPVVFQSNATEDTDFALEPSPTIESLVTNVVPTLPGSQIGTRITTEETATTTIKKTVDVTSTITITTIETKQKETTNLSANSNEYVVKEFYKGTNLYNFNFTSKNKIILGNKSGSVNLFFSSLGKIKITIYQLNINSNELNVIAGTHNNQVITSSLTGVTNFSDLKTKSLNSNISNIETIINKYSDLFKTYDISRSADPDTLDFVSGVGVITFTHIPVNGKEYFITVDSLGNGNWVNICSYPTDLENSQILDVNKIFNNTNYVAGSSLPNSGSKKEGTIFKIDDKSIKSSIIIARGLKPLTTHYLFFDGIKIQQIPEQFRILETQNKNNVVANMLSQTLLDSCYNIIINNEIEEFYKNNLQFLSDGINTDINGQIIFVINNKYNYQDFDISKIKVIEISDNPSIDFDRNSVDSYAKYIN